MSNGCSACKAEKAWGTDHPTTVLVVPSVLHTCVEDRMRVAERRVLEQMAAYMYRADIGPPNAPPRKPNHWELARLRTSEAWLALREWVAVHVLRVDIHQGDCDHWE